MDRPPLDVSPVAKFLIGLVERRASGAVVLPQRSVQLSNGDVQDVTAANGDQDFGDFLLRSGRITSAELARTRDQALAGAMVFEQALTGQSRLRPAETRALKRALWLDRFLRSLRESLAGSATLPVLAALPELELAANSGERMKFLPLILDAFGRIALDAEAATVGVRLKHRLIWLDVPLAAEAKSWACLGDISEQPVIAALLARLPACAPQIAALLRAGFIQLEEPGGLPVRRLSRTETLPPPAPRLAVLPDSPPALPSPRSDSTKPASRSERAHAPQLQLDPGGSGVPIERIPSVPRTAWPSVHQPLHDPVRELEQSLASETTSSSERAQGFVELARLWATRFGSLEEATRALREAVAADPDNTALMEQAAQQCFRLGQGELAVRYANAALAAQDDTAERARQHKLIAKIQQARGDLDACIQALSEAAAEYPEDPAPHEGMAQILSDRDQLAQAAAHVRVAASQCVVHDPERALLLHSLAYSWHPSDPASAAEYADLLEKLGHPEAAIAIVAETARNLYGAERREALERAAERAERNKRRDLRAELLLEIFDAEPSYQEIHAPLAASTDRPGLEAEYAALLESIARYSHGAHRAEVLARCADALARVDGEREASARYQQFARQLRTPLPAADRPRDAGVLIAELEAQLTAARGAAPTQNTTQQLARLAALRAELGDARGVVSACLRLLSVEPEHAMAAARLWRATAELSDQVLHRESLVLLARMRRGREQGRALAVLARQIENMGDFDAAVTSAEAALAQDPSAADAAVIALRHVHRLEPRRALSLLAQARGLLASPPALLLSMAEAARAAADHGAQLATLHELNQGLPFLMQPRLLALDAALATPDAEQISVEANALLDHCAGPEVTEHGRTATARLAELGDYASAARLAERLMDCQGYVDAPYADRACSFAHMSADPTLIAIAFERAASVHEGAARADCLLQLAAHHASQTDRVAEMRALLRALALPEGRSRALPVLAQRFAQSGDRNRLLTVLALRLDATSEPEARRQQLFDTACAVISLGDDRGAAVAYMNALFHESANDRAGLLFGLGGLFALGDAAWATATAREIAHTLSSESAGVIYLWLASRAELEGASALAFELAAEGARRFPSVGELLLLAERLTLATGDKPAALALYADLVAAAMGPHGERALHYRAGRWLERAGEPAEALVYYQRAFALAPGAGVAFHALARVARAAHQLEALIEAQQTLASLLNDDQARALLLAAAARTSLQDIGDPARAMRIVADADSGVPPGRLDGILAEAAAQLAKTAPDAARKGLKLVADARRARIDQLWDGEVKAELLLSLARLHRSARDDVNAALQCFELVLNSDLRTSLSSETLAAGLVDFAEALGRRGRQNEAQAALSEARLLMPNLPRAHVPDAGAEASPAVASSAQRDRFWSATPSATTALTGLGPREEELRTRADAGDAEALDELVRLLDTDETRRDEAHALLGKLVRIAPERTAALRQLHARALELGAQAEAHVCAQILALFEPTIGTAARIPFDPADLSSDELLEIVNMGQNRELAQLLGLAWQHAQAVPRFRRAAAALQPGELVAANDGSPLAAAHARASSMLGYREVLLYARPGAFPEASALPTYPPAIVARSGLSDQTALEFQIARCLVYCQPEHALLCTLPEAEGRELLTALLEAFGFTAKTQPLTRTDKELASEFWHIIPVRVQTQMRDLLEPRVKELDYTALRLQAERSAQRAGLFVASDVQAALKTIARTEDTLRDCNVQTEAGFQRACQASEAFREIIRSALSLPYVGLTALTLEPGP
jgi:tetratricopeptide (TPR) repeat protein